MKRLLIMGVLDRDISRVVRRQQENLSSLTGNRLALEFPVHITLRGPFWTDAEVHTLSEIVSGVCQSHHGVQVILDEPSFIEPDLCWREVSSASPGIPALRALNRELDYGLMPYIAVDDVPAIHKGDNYRPHVTLGWGIDAAVPENHLHLFKPSPSIAAIECVAIAGYPEGWPAGGAVKILNAFGFIS